MKPNEVKAARVRLGYTQRDVADRLGLTLCTYRVKESGKVNFKDTEKATLARVLELTPSQMNDFLFDGILPI